MALVKNRRKSTKTASPVKRSFTQIMDETTQDMPRYRRMLSRFIHFRLVTSVSQVLATTITRPNAILFGAVASFSLTLMAYLLSKNLGYSLSGFESIGAFAVGWAAGIIFDAASILLGRRS